MKNSTPPSRLRLAWTVFFLAVAGLALAALLVPPPEAGRQDVALALPAAPDGLAPAAGTAEGAGPDEAASRLGDAADGAAPGQRASEDDLPEGALVITIPDAEGAAEAPRGPAARPPLPPRADLSLKTPDGTRPERAPDGSTAFSAYRRSQTLAEGEAGVAVVLGGLGLDPGATRRAIALPAEISLAFAPYAKDLPALIEEARDAGHEALIELPMGTPGVAPAALGPAALLADRPEAGNARRLDWLLARAPAYAMATNYLGRGFSQSEAGMSLVMSRLSRAGLGYVDDTGLAEEEARAAGVPFVRTDRLIAGEDGPILTQLDAFTARAEEGRVAVAKLYLSAEALNALELWAKRLPDDVALMPASSAARMP